jgi:threonine synthase
VDYPEPVKPDTIAKSIAIGNPADGFQAIEVIKASGGWGAAVTDAEILDAVRLLAECEGIFTEPAGGTTLAATRRLIQQGRIPRDEPIVVCITGNGYKTAEVMLDHTAVQPVPLGRRLADFEAWIASADSAAR